MKLSLPSSVAASTVSVGGELVASDSSETRLSLAQSSDAAWVCYSALIPSGEYALLLDAENLSSQKIATATGAVWVFACLVTAETIDLSSGEVNTPPEAPTALAADSETSTSISLSWTDTGMTPSTTYAYRIAAQNSFGSSSWGLSGTISTQAQGSPLAASRSRPMLSPSKSEARRRR